MKWIGTKIEQFTTRFYSSLYCDKDFHSVLVYIGDNLAIGNGIVTGAGNQIDFYNQGIAADDNSFNFIQMSPNSIGGEQAGTMLNIHKYGITASNGVSHGGNPTALIDNNQISNLAGNSVALHVDFDRTVPTGGTAVHNDIGINLDVTSDSLGSGSTTVGMDIDVVSGTSSTSDNQVATGIHLDVDGADTNIGMVINTAGTHLKLEANADVNDYATFTLADTGDLTIATVGSATIDSDLTLDADGQIKLEPAAGKNILLDGTIAIDEGVVTGATSITSTAFVGDVTGTADVATVATTVTITDNESTNEANSIIFTAGGSVEGGNLGLESDGTLTYNPSTGSVTATAFKGDLTGDVTGGSIRGNLIYVETCNFTDNLGTDEHFIPFVSSAESTAFANMVTPWMAPVAGKLLKVHWRSNQHNNVSSNEISFRLYKTSDGTRWSGTNESLLGTKVVTGPARTTHVIADFTSGLESTSAPDTNAFAANDLLGISVQHSAAQGTTEKITVTLVFELDFTSY